MEKVCKVCGAKFDAKANTLTCSVLCGRANSKANSKAYRSTPEYAEVMRIAQERYRKANPEKVRFFSDRWAKKNARYLADKRMERRRSDPDFRERELARRRGYYWANREKLIAYGKKYRKENRGLIAEWEREKARKDPVAWAAKQAKAQANRAKKKAWIQFQQCQVELKGKVTK